MIATIFVKKLRKKLLLALCLVAANLFAQEQLPQWASDIQTLNPGLVDSILYYYASPVAPNTRTYVIYYNQPLNHSQSGSAHFPLRALITVNTNGNPTTAVNHVFASGYSIMGAVLGIPQGLEDVRTENLEVRTEKVIRDGKLYILRAGKTYDTLGREVK